MINELDTAFDKLFKSSFFTPKVKGFLIIFIVALLSGMIFTFFAFFGFIFMFLGIGLIMLLVQTIFSLILATALIIRIFKNKINYVEWGLLLGIFWAAVSLVRLFLRSE